MACIRTSDIECEVPSNFLSSCSCHLTGVCPSITNEGCIDSQDVFIVNVFVQPGSYTLSILAGPGVVEWGSIWYTNNPAN